MSERKDWRKRRCEHGEVDYRIQLDIAHCKEPGCLESKMARLGWMRIPPEKPSEEDPR